MNLWLCLLLWLAAPFWETKAPADWTDAEARSLLQHSPWAEPSSGNVQTYLATARPAIEAEARWFRTGRQLREGAALSDEYLEYRDRHAGKVIILAVHLPDWQALADAAESRRMEEATALRVGRRKYGLQGHFPPAPGDPFLRLVFPRAVTEADRTLLFEIYLPNASPPFQEAEYEVKKLRWRGTLEM